VKKQQKWPKNERDSCMPEPKNGERPYLAPSVPAFLGLIFATFWSIFTPILYPRFSFYHPEHPAHTRTLHRIAIKPVLGIISTLTYSLPILIY